MVSFFLVDFVLIRYATVPSPKDFCLYQSRRYPFLKKIKIFIFCHFFKIFSKNLFLHDFFISHEFLWISWWKFFIFPHLFTFSPRLRWINLPQSQHLRNARHPQQSNTKKRELRVFLKVWHGEGRPLGDENNLFLWRLLAALIFSLLIFFLFEKCRQICQKSFPKKWLFWGICGTSNSASLKKMKGFSVKMRERDFHVLSWKNINRIF